MPHLRNDLIITSLLCLILAQAFTTNLKFQQKFFHDFVQTYSGLKLYTAQSRNFMLLKSNSELQGIIYTSTSVLLVRVVI